MLGSPLELYTPLFAIARVVGWSAHRIEELVGMGKIIRPAYKSVMEEIEYLSGGGTPPFFSPTDLKLASNRRSN